MITSNPFDTQNPTLVLKKYTPSPEKAARGTVEEYNGKTKKFDKEYTTQRPAATIPELIDVDLKQGTYKYRMPDGSTQNVPRGSPAPSSAPQKSESKNAEKDNEKKSK
jgi:hypothetical protein